MTSFDVCTVEGCNEDMARDLSLAEANAAHQRCIQNGAFCFLNALVLELGLEKVMDAVAEVETARRWSVGGHPVS